jgi:hypothetical protein
MIGKALGEQLSEDYRRNGHQCQCAIFCKKFHSHKYSCVLGEDIVLPRSVSEEICSEPAPLTGRVCIRVLELFWQAASDRTLFTACDEIFPGETGICDLGLI